MPEEVANSGCFCENRFIIQLLFVQNNGNIFGKALEKAIWLCYTPSLPLIDAKWSLFGLHFFSIYAICPVFMRLLEF